jgi:hypothetical protein
VNVPTYTVILAIRWRGATVGSTEDVIEAETAAEAIEKAVQAWRVVRPDCLFRALLVL